MPLTAAHIQKALSAVGALGSQMKSAAELASGANGALAQAPSGLTEEGAAAFLATLTQESDYLRTTTEYGRGQRYAPYIGRTFEQVTWRENYAAFGKWCKDKGLVSDADYFVDNPARLSDYKWAWLGGVWYFQHAGLWKYANRGDFKAVSQGVNGGVGRIGTSFTPNGWTHRHAMYRAYLLAGSALLPDGKAAPGKPKPAARKITVDGHFGPGTARALQGLAGTPQDGVISGQPKTIRGKHAKTWATYWHCIEWGDGGSRVVAWLQGKVGAGLARDGVLGPKTVKATQNKVGVDDDGDPGPKTVRAIQTWINELLEEEK